MPEVATARNRIAPQSNGDDKPERKMPHWPVDEDNPHRYKFHQRTEPAKIAIIGKAPSSMSLAPYSDPTWEIWSINDTVYRKMIPRADRQFELHNIALTKQPGYDDYYPWLCATDMPVFVNDDYPEIKNRIVYPRHAVVDEFPFFTLLEQEKQYVLAGRGITYYTNSISYLIALAIYELKGVEKDSFIGLWGVDMAQHGRWVKSEYAAQRPSCELFMGAAVGRGIGLVVPEQCDMMKCKSMYGFDTYSDMHQKMAVREKELQDRISACRRLSEEKKAEATFLEGAFEDLQYMKQWL